MLELVINKKENIKTIMLVENGRLIEKHDEHENQKRLEGNIYLGIVRDVISGMQSAFVDIGENKNTLLKLTDALPKVNFANEQKSINTSIEKILKPKDKILIQIKRDGTLTKGAKVSTHINLPGRFVVIMPNTNIITVSKKIENGTRIEELKQIAKSILPENMGIIFRTSSQKIKNNEIEEEINYLLNLWKKIENDFENSKKVNSAKLLYDNNALIRRTLIDIIDNDLNKVIINDKKTYEKTKNMLKEFNSDVEVILKEENLLNMYELSEQTNKMKNRKIWLKCGGFITIDKTEALTAIDVNTGKYIGKKNLEQTVFTVNKEATEEIAKQLRLRDIGGIIIIDYIDMQDIENRNKIKELLEKELRKDRTKNQIVGFTKLNLLEMTRKNMCNNDWNSEDE